MTSETPGSVDESAQEGLSGARAEEAARRVPVKLLFPLVLCVLPAFALLTVAPLLAGAHWSLGLVYEKEGRKQDAIAELETSLRLKPDFEPAQKDLKRLK